MPGKVNKVSNLQGLFAQEVPALRQQYEKNVFHAESSRRIIHIVWDIVKDTMFILLVIACLLYFILGEVSEGIKMLVAITGLMKLNNR